MEVGSTGVPYGCRAMNRVWLPERSALRATSRVFAPSGTFTKYDVVPLRCTEPDVL